MKCIFAPSLGGYKLISKDSVDIFDKSTLDTANLMFDLNDNAYSEETRKAFIKTMKKGWLTRQYFSKGKHDLVLPAWLLGILGPSGEGRHGIAGLPFLNNTDLRSYTALGSPDSEEEPVVDHRGGVIPVPGSYTLLFGTLIDDRPFYSSEIGDIEIEQHEEGFPIVTVYWNVDNDTMVYDLFADRDEDGNEALGMNVVRGFANHPLFITLCPLDQDGLTKIKTIDYDNKEFIVKCDQLPQIRVSEQPIRVVALPVIEGHAGRQVNNAKLATDVTTCQASTASWAAAFPVRANPNFMIVLNGEPDSNFPDIDDVEEKWEDLIETLPQISTSDEQVDYFFKASAITLRLLVDAEESKITVGPSVQEEVWIPALLFQTMALDRMGFSDVVEPVLDQIINNIDTNGIVADKRQWDSQGALVFAFLNHYFITKNVNWIGDKYSFLKRVGDWVIRQRKKKETDGTPNPLLHGLLEKGHPSWFDPIYWKLDYYYSHNFWSAGVINSLAILAEELGKHGESEKYLAELEKYKQDIDDSITRVINDFQFLPNGPLQRDNAEMIFNLYAFYPLRLYLPGFQPIVNTLHWLWNNYVQEGGVLIDQPHNAYGTYLSTLIAQAYRYIEEFDKIPEIIDFLIRNVTNKSGWAEGISPLSNKGAVGDSPNGFMAAEWINLILDLFCEQPITSPPIFLKGMPVEWLKKGVEAKQMLLHHNMKVDISAVIERDQLVIDWNIETKEQNLRPHLYLPFHAKKIPNEIDQLSTNVVVLPSSKGSTKISLDMK